MFGVAHASYVFVAEAKHVLWARYSIMILWVVIKALVLIMHDIYAMIGKNNVHNIIKAHAFFCVNCRSYMNVYWMAVEYSFSKITVDFYLILDFFNRFFSLNFLRCLILLFFLR